MPMRAVCVNSTAGEVEVAYAVECVVGEIVTRAISPTTRSNALTYVS